MFHFVCLEKCFFFFCFFAFFLFLHFVIYVSVVRDGCAASALQEIGSSDPFPLSKISCLTGKILSEIQTRA